VTIASMETQYAYSPPVILVDKADRPQSINGGLASIVNINTSYSSRSFGDFGSDKQTQVSQYFGAVASCVRYRSQVIGQVPSAVRVGTKEERTKSEYNRRAWSIRYKHFADGRGDDPGYCPPSRWMSDIKKKSAAGNVRSHEELEYLDNEHPLVRLLNDPNGPQTGEQFWPLLNTYLDLCGVAYVWVVPDSAGIPAAMWVVPSQLVEEVPRDAKTEPGELIGYFKINGVGSVNIGSWDTTSTKGRFGNGGIIRFSVDSPLGVLVPDSRVFAHRFDVDMLGMIQSARYASLQNGGEAGAVIEIDPNVNVEANVMQRFIDQFQQRYAGINNQNKPWWMPAGFKMNRSDSSREVALSGSEQKAWERVWEIFDLDYNAMVKAGNANYAAPAVARQNFRFNVVVPRHKYLASVLTEKLCPVYGVQTRVIFEDAGGYQDPQEKRANFQAAAQYPTGPAITINEYRKELLNLEPIDDPAADMLWASPGMVPLEDLVQMSADTSTVPRGTVPTNTPENQGQSVVDEFKNALGNSIEPDELEAAKILMGKLFTKEMGGRSEGVDSMGRRYRIEDGKRVPIGDGGDVKSKLKTLAEGVKKKSQELAVKVSDAVREKGVPVDKVNAFIDGFMQTMAVKQFDAFHHHLGLDYQTTIEILTHVVAHATSAIKKKLKTNTTKGANLLDWCEGCNEG
jgi:hypothetical protein